MDDHLIYVPFPNDDNQNYLFCRFKHRLKSWYITRFETTYKIFEKYPKNNITWVQFFKVSLYLEYQSPKIINPFLCIWLFWILNNHYWDQTLFLAALWCSFPFSWSTSKMKMKIASSDGISLSKTHKWMDLFIMYSNKLKLVAGSNNDFPQPFLDDQSSYLMTNLTKKWCSCYQSK